MVTHRHIDYLKSKLECCHGYSYPELYEWHDEFLRHKSDEKKSLFRWKNRYCSLRQDTPFFKNLLTIEKIIWKCSSVEEFKVKVDMLGISDEAVNFVICYIWMCPCRVFSSDWRYAGAKTPTISVEESFAWDIVDRLYDDISQNNLPMLEVEDFMKLNL